MESLKTFYFALESFFLKFKRKKDVLFPVDNELMLSYALQVSRLLADDSRLRLWFCLHSPQHFLDVRQAESVKSLRTIPYALAKKMPWDLIVYPSHAPYFRKSSPKIYIGHGLSSGKSVKGKHYIFSENSRDLEGEIIYEKIFSSSDFLSDQIRNFYSEFAEKIRVVGSLLVDDVLDQNPDRKKMLNRHGLDPARKVIMICSSWGPLSMIQSRGQEMTAIIPRLCREYNVVLSLHINNFNQVHYQGIDVEALLSTLQDQDHLYIMPPGYKSEKVLPWTDMMISDMTSLALYFPFFKRPMIYFDHPDLEFTDSGLMKELIERIPHFNDPRDLPDIVEQLFFTELKEQFDEVICKISSYPAQSRRRYLEEIYDTLNIDALAAKGMVRPS